jgi:hypothetical protein
MPRPCRHCLEITGRVVELVPEEPQAADPGDAEET